MSTDQRRMTLWVLAWPVFIEMLLQFLLGTVDTWMGSHISDDAVAVIGISNQLFAAVNILFVAIASGTGILVAQRLGARRDEEARLLGIMGVKVSIFIGAGLSLLLYFFAAPISRLLQVPTELLPLAKTYMSIVGSGMIFIAAMAAFGSVVRNTGNTRGPMYIAIGMNVIHVFTNYTVIYGAFGMPKLGLEGVAVSTLISRLLAACALFYVYRQAFPRTISLKDWKLFDRPLFKETIKLSWPLGVNMSSWCLTQLVIYAFIAHIGAVELSTRTYMNTLESFCFMLGFAIALAGQIRIAHLYGSRQMDTAYHEAFRVMRIGLLLVMANTILLVAIGRPTLGLFTHDQEILKLGVSILGLNLLLQPSKMLNMAIGNALTAVGETRFMMISGIISMWTVAIGVSYFLAIHLGWGLYGIYTAMISDELLRGLMVVLRWRSRKFMAVNGAIPVKSASTAGAGAGAAGAAG